MSGQALTYSAVTLYNCEDSFPNARGGFARILSDARVRDWRPSGTIRDGDVIVQWPTADLDDGDDLGEQLMGEWKREGTQAHETAIGGNRTLPVYKKVENAE